MSGWLLWLSSVALQLPTDFLLSPSHHCSLAQRTKDTDTHRRPLSNPADYRVQPRLNPRWFWNLSQPHQPKSVCPAHPSAFWLWVSPFHPSASWLWVPVSPLPSSNPALLGTALALQSKPEPYKEGP